MEERARAQRVAAVRDFNRFFTRRIGLLHEGLLGTDMSLSEGRVLYELAQRDGATAGELAAALGLDPGYLSRILRRFESKALLRRVRSAADGRRSKLSLTAEGRTAFAEVDARSAEEIDALLAPLSEDGQEQLVRAMATVRRLLGGAPAEPLVLREHRPGDIGWVVARHGALYAAEYGWTIDFEAMVARIAADFIDGFDPSGDRCWIAEADGVRAGCVFVVRQSDEVAKLRLLLVEPWARGRGIGARLVYECIGFARAAGYRRIALWTNDILDAARHIYDRAGFRVVAREPHHSFGQDLVGETWELAL